MGPRVALRSTVSSDVFDRVMQYTGFTFMLPFNTAKGGLGSELPVSVQQLIHQFADRPVPQLDENPVGPIYHPMMDSAALEEFGLWCRQGCPVTVDGLVYRYRHGTSQSSDGGRRVYTF